MKQDLYSLTASLFTKLALVTALIIGWGNTALADTVIFDGSVASGWTYTNKSGGNLSVTSNTLNYYSQTDYRYYTSESTINITAGQTIVISAKKYGTSSGETINVNYSSDNGETWDKKETFSPSDKDNYSEFVVENLVGTYKIQFEFKYVHINSIILKDASTNPVLSITPPAGGNAFGYVKVNTTKTYTIQNTGVGSVDVNISSDNDVFSLSTSSLTDITNDGIGKTFDVTYNYDASQPQPHAATITITPTVEGVSAQTINITAGPEVEFNEDKATTWTTGSGKNVYVKYTAKDGWNTICFPISPNSYKTQLFGAGTVAAYALTSFDTTTGTISFESASYMGARTPYLVYVENAASTSFVVENVYVGYTSGDKITKDGITFQGTFAPKEAGTLTGNYGVTQDGRIAKAGDGASMKGYRAYLTGLPANSSVKMIVINSDTPTDVGLLQMVESTDKNVYTLSGQKVQKARKGLYIMNGKKVVVK